MRIEYNLTIPNLFIASWNKDFATDLWDWIFAQPIFNLSTENYCCKRLFTTTARCGDILEPCFSSNAKSLEEGPRNGLFEPVIQWRFYQPNLFYLRDF